MISYEDQAVLAAVAAARELRAAADALDEVAKKPTPNQMVVALTKVRKHSDEANDSLWKVAANARKLKVPVHVLAAARGVHRMTVTTRLKTPGSVE